MSKLTTIYALVDPRNNEVRYVGKTVNVNRRKITHRHDLRNSNTRKVRWMKTLLPLEPEMILLEECYNWQEAEQFWIAYLKGLGARLTNATAGGEGVQRLEVSEETRRKLSESHKGHKDSEETKIKKSLAAKGKPKSAKHAENIRKAQTGIKRTPEQCKRIAEATKLAKDKDPTYKERISAALKGREAHNKGVAMLEEQKKKVSEGLKRYFAEQRRIKETFLASIFCTKLLFQKL